MGKGTREVGGEREGGKKGSKKEWKGKWKCSFVDVKWKQDRRQGEGMGKNLPYIQIPYYEYTTNTYY